MDTMDTNPQSQTGVMDAGEQRGIKQKLGNLGRRIKHVDLRAQIVTHPFAAVGIAAGIGAIIGLARPMPQRGRISGALFAMLGGIGYRLVREAAITQLGQYARGFVQQKQGEREGMQAQAPQAGTSSSAPY